MNNHLFLQRRERLMDLKNLRENKSTRRAVKAVAGKCPGCSAAVPAAELAKNLYVCPQCGRHHTIGAYLRLSLLLDPGSFRELDERLASPNVLDFPGYPSISYFFPRCRNPKCGPQGTRHVTSFKRGG